MVLSWPAAGIALAGLLVAGVGWWQARRMARSLADAAQSARAMAGTLQAKIGELEAGRTQLTGILQSMAEGVLAVGSTGEILLVNPAARHILGIGSGARATRSLSDVVRIPEIQTIVQEIQRTGRPCARDLTMYAPSERHLRVHAATCSYAPWTRPGQPPQGACVLLVLHDITDFKRLENVRREFVANVSHELKTPLTAIQGAVETLLDGALSDTTHSRPFVESIAEETSHLRRLVDDLLTLAQVESRQAALKRESIPLKAFLEEAMARHQALAVAHQVSLTLETPESLSPVPADRGQLAQAIGNLLDNAIKYNRPGGQVIVRASEADRQLRIEVEDTGIGIPSEDLPRIFERFYRVDKARSRETGGTGLGLSIVKHVAEAHGGSVVVESQPHQGSRFTLILSRTQAS